MQAIQTKLLLVTTTKPYRIKASCPAGSLTLGVDNLPYAYHDERAHRHVAQKLADKLQWDLPMIGGDTKEGFCFVFIPQQVLNKLGKESFEVKQAIII